MVCVGFFMEFDGFWGVVVKLFLLVFFLLEFLLGKDFVFFWLEYFVGLWVYILLFIFLFEEVFVLYLLVSFFGVWVVFIIKEFFL